MSNDDDDGAECLPGQTRLPTTVRRQQCIVINPDLIVHGYYTVRRKLKDLLSKDARFQKPCTLCEVESAC
jgi:hypothetical protein